MEKRVEEVHIEALVPYKNNARTNSPRQVKEIARSIKVYGFTSPVLADEHNVILAVSSDWKEQEEIFHE